MSWRCEWVWSDSFESSASKQVTGWPYTGGIPNYLPYK